MTDTTTGPLGATAAVTALPPLRPGRWDVTATPATWASAARRVTWLAPVHRTLSVTLDPVPSEHADGALFDDEPLTFTGQVGAPLAGGRAVVRVRVDDGDWVPVERVVLDEWVFTTSEALPAGRHLVQVAVTDTSGVQVAAPVRELHVHARG